jgi:protoporphyrinogen oxidase
VKVAVLGGGLTGVTIARLLHDRGEEVTVFEQEPTYGGLCRSRTEQGFTYDLGGSHIIFSRDAEVLSFMHRMLEGNREFRERNTKIYHRGTYVKYPFENGLYQLEREECFTCLREFIHTLIQAEKRAIPPPSNFQEWMYCTFGKGITDLYLLPYNEKIWKYPADQMSCHWVEGRIPRPPMDDILRSAIGIETEGYTHQIHFSYPVKGGIEALIKAIAAPLEERIRTGFRVRSIRWKEGRFVISDGQEEMEADRLISTIPLQALLPALPAVPNAIKEACNALKYNSLYCVFLGIRGSVPEYSWVYIPDPATGLFNRISFPSNYSHQVTPPGHSSILAEITFRQGDEVDRMDPESIRSHVIHSLVAMGLLTSPADVVYSAVERQKYAYVIYDLEYLSHITLVRDYCQSLGIQLVGRFSQFEYLNMDGCIRNAMDLVQG